MVESKKSTLKFTSKELDIIILFLRVNFKEKIEFVPLIKKVRSFDEKYKFLFDLKFVFIGSETYEGQLGCDEETMCARRKNEKPL